MTSDRWRATRARMSAWERGGERRQSTGTTPASRFTMPYAFGNRADPGAGLPYRRLDRSDVWPHEPRDAATYNIFQPHKVPGSP